MGRPVNTKESNRPARIPVGGRRNILTVTGLDQQNFVARWVNDVDDRIERFKDAGYEFVTTPVKVGDRTTGVIGEGENRVVSKRVGGGITAYLMQIPREFYEQDQRAKEAEIKAVEAQMIQKVRDSEYRKAKIEIQNAITPQSKATGEE